MPRVLLISLRDAHDPMAHHERLCFAERAGVEPSAIRVHPMVEGRPPRRLWRESDAVLFGGSGAYSVLDDVRWIRESLDVLVEVVEDRVPAWASCFGFQGLTLALGGRVAHDAASTEMGSTLLTLTEEGQHDPLFSGLPDRFWAQQGHHDRVVELPEGVELLARGEVCEAQAFRVKGAPFWASQFHPELTVQRTLDRFRHYRDQYLASPDGDAVLRRLERGQDTPAVGQLLWRLVRGEFTSSSSPGP